MPMTWLAWTMRTLAGNVPARAEHGRLVADEDDLVSGVRAGEIERAGTTSDGP